MARKVKKRQIYVNSRNLSLMNCVEIVLSSTLDYKTKY